MMLYLLLSCKTSDEPIGSIDSPQEEILPEIEETVVGEEDLEETVKNPSRQLKRMTIPQVRDAMERISGGIQWGDGNQSDWDVFADTLGVADYQLRVESDRSASVMFQKFLDDAAAGTCLEWLRAEQSSFFSMEDPTSVERADVRSSIVDLRWQIQGKAKDETARIIDDYEALFFKVHQRTDSTELSWQTVCVAMFTHPDFFMY